MTRQAISLGLDALTQQEEQNLRATALRQASALRHAQIERRGGQPVTTDLAGDLHQLWEPHDERISSRGD